MKKKLVAILLTAAMTVSLAACGSSSSDTAASTPANDAAASTEEAADDAAADSTEAATEEAAAEIDPNDPWAGWANIDTSEPVVINYMCVSDKPTNPDTDEMMEVLNGILQEKVNATLELNYIGWTDYLTNYNLTLTPMDGSVDLVVTADDWLDAWQNVERGAFMELPDEMLQTYAPATWQQVEEDGDWDMCRYTDGQIYLIPEDNYRQWTNHGFIYRLDWAKEAGLEDGVHSWDDMTTYFQYCLDTFPDMIPWDVVGGNSINECTGGYLASAGVESYPLTGVAAGIVGYPGNQVKCQYLEETDALVAYGNLMKTWNDMGVWRTDVLNNSTSDTRQAFREGRGAVDQHHTETWTDLASPGRTANVFYQEDPDAAAGFFWFGEESNFLVNLSILHGAMAISSGSQNPERALMVYDLLRNDPECYRLFMYGIEGEQYELVGENEYKRPEGYNDTEDKVDTAFWAGRNDDIGLKDSTLNWDVIEPLYAEYDEIAVDNPYLQFLPVTDEISGTMSTLTEICNNYLKLLTYGQFQGTAEECVAEFQDQLRAAGAEDVVANLQAQMDAFYGTSAAETTAAE